MDAAGANAVPAREGLLIKLLMSSKRLPWKNSPTNIPGQKMETINKESIIVLQKIR